MSEFANRALNKINCTPANQSKSVCTYDRTASVLEAAMDSCPRNPDHTQGLQVRSFDEHGLACVAVAVERGEIGGTSSGTSDVVGASGACNLKLTRRR